MASSPLQSTTPTVSTSPTTSTTSTSSTTSTTPTTTSTTSTPTSTSTPPTTASSVTTAPPVQQTTFATTTSAGAAPIISSNGGSTLESSSTSSTAETTSSLTTTLSVASTSVGEAVTLATSSDGQVYTTTLAFTTTLAAGSVVTSTSIVPASGSNRTSTGVIVGGVVGGVGGLILLAALVFFCLRRRRKDEFDGNFDPVNVSSGGGTLPKIDLGENGLLMDGNGVGVEEDDGMGGRLGAGPGAGGIITPYSFQPAPVGGTAIGGQQYQDHPQMQQMSNIGVAADGVGAVGALTAAGYPNEKRTMRHQQYGQHSQSLSSGSLYPPSSSHGNQQMNPTSVSPEPRPYSMTSDGSSAGGSASGEIYYQSMGRVPSPGHSAVTSSSGGRNAKEMEAMGRFIATNPDEGRGQFPAFQQAYLQTGPGPHQHQQYMPSSSSSTPIPSQQFSQQPHSPAAVVVHADGGRVPLQKGEEAEEDRVELSPEIPPTYDSLPAADRRDS